MNIKKYLVERDRAYKIFKLALPVTLGLASSFVMVFVDLAMVGSLGPVALAAIGLGGFSFTFVLASVLGVAPAIQGIVAKSADASSDRKDNKLCEPLNAGLLLVFIIGVPLTLLCIWITPSFFSLLSDDPLVVIDGTKYLQVILVAVVGAGMIQAFEGFWAGISKTHIYMFNIFFVNGLNIFLNYIFIFGNFGSPAYGTMGAAIGSVVAIYAGVFLYILTTFFYFRKDKFLSIWPNKDLVLRIFSTGLPESIRDALFSLGYLVFYWLVGQMGTSELAAMNVLIRIALVMAVFPIALGVAASTLVGEAVGRGDLSDANRWGWDVSKIGFFWVTVIGMPLWLFPSNVLSLFIVDPNVIKIAITPLQLTGALTGVTSLIFIFAYVLVSLGDGVRVLLVSVGTQWLLFLPAVWLVGPYLNYGLLEIWLVQTTYALTATAMITALWCDGRWKKITHNTTEV